MTQSVAKKGRPKRRPMLTEQQKIAADEYLQCWSKVEAYRRAGYKGKDQHAAASQLFANPRVAAYVAKRIKDRKDRLCITTDDVLFGLVLEAEDRENGTPASRVAAWTQIGKAIGMFNERPEQNINLHVNEIRHIIVSAKAEDREDVGYTNGRSLPAPSRPS